MILANKNSLDLKLIQAKLRGRCLLCCLCEMKNMMNVHKKNKTHVMCFGHVDLTRIYVRNSSMQGEITLKHVFLSDDPITV